VIQNVDDISDDPLLWLGSSATIDDPKRFGGQIFGRSPADVETTSPPPSDYDDDHDDFEHYYFMLAPEDGPESPRWPSSSRCSWDTRCWKGDGQRSKQLSFIDSISQINQQRVQLDDADRKNELWQFHRNDDEENWDTVASDMGHRFIDEPLSLMSVYSNRVRQRDGREERRPPLDELPRGGYRRGRYQDHHPAPDALEPVVVPAAGWPGRPEARNGLPHRGVPVESHRRREYVLPGRPVPRLRHQDPLNTDNRVVEWMHDRFNRYYDHVSWLDDQFYRSTVDEHRTFLERYLQSDLGYDSFYEMIVDPGSFFESGVRYRRTERADALEASRWRRARRTRLVSRRQHETVADVEEYFGMEDGEIVRGRTPSDSTSSKYRSRRSW